jgi:Pretoxin HINT domain
MNTRAMRRRLPHRTSKEHTIPPSTEGKAPRESLSPSAIGRRASRWSGLVAAGPLLLSLALLAFFVTRPSGAAPASRAPLAAASASVLAQASLGAGRVPARAGHSTSHVDLPTPEPDDAVRVFNRRTGAWDEARFRDVPKGSEVLHAGRLLRVSHALGALQWVRDVDVAELAAADTTHDPAAPRREPEADDVVRVLGEGGRHTTLGRVESGERVAFQGRVYETRAGPGDRLEVRDTGLRVNRVTRTYQRHSPTLIDLAVRYGDGREGVLTGTPEHPFFVPALGGYVPMGELAMGVALRTTDGAEAAVTARSERHGDFEVYNLEVEHTHNYFVSPPGSDGPGVQVHNATYGTGGKGPPNPYGKRGGPAHQAKVDKIAKDIEARGLTPDFEHKVSTTGGTKGTRYVDVVAKDAQGKVVEMHQVGKQTQGGAPVAREVKALDDIQGSTGVRPTYHPYND